jgi:N-methylhydantoinase A
MRCCKERERALALLTTKGHRDVIEMREGLKPDRYNLRMAPPVPLVPRRLRVPVTERVRADGSVEIPLDMASLAAAIDYLREADVQAVAVCFLHAWRNPAHEQRPPPRQRPIAAAYVTTSFDAAADQGCERFSINVANAAVGPVVQNYLERLQSRLRKAGYKGELLVILSHGGVASVAEAISRRELHCQVLPWPLLLRWHGGARGGYHQLRYGRTSTDISVLRERHCCRATSRLPE